MNAESDAASLGHRERTRLVEAMTRDIEVVILKARLEAFELIHPIGLAGSLTCQ
jgi:hypothetical protein